MYFKETEFYNIPEFLASQHYVNFTRTIFNDGIEADDNGKKYILAGSLISDSGKIVTFDGSSFSEEPIGITFNTIDVTYGSQPVAVIFEGYVITERLQLENISTAKTILKEKLPNIKFM